MGAYENNDLAELQEVLYTSKSPTRRWLHNTRRDWINRTIHSLLNAPEYIRSLEVGPGAGGYLPVLAQVSKSVIASDIEQKYLSHSKNANSQYRNIEYLVDDITCSEIQEKSFDLILCTEVVEHIEESLPALKGLRSLLASDGKLILSTPQRYSPLEVCAKIAFLPGIIEIVRFIYREPIIPTGHINLLTESELKDQIKAAGLTIHEEYKCGFYFPIIAELLGKFGLKIERWIERKIYGTRLDFLLWTQCYVLLSDNKPGDKVSA